MKLLLLTVLTAAAILAAIPSSAAAAQRCGSIPRAAVSLLDVRAKATSCRTARIVTRQWLRNVLAGRCTRFVCRSRAYTCTARPPARVSYRVRCKARAGKRVGFKVVAD